jgi:membrane associated rhomboid family serine protease
MSGAGGPSSTLNWLPMRYLPPATRAILIANVVIYLLQYLTHNAIEGPLALWPLGSSYFHPWQLVTYAFLHDYNNVWHIFFNMFALFMFGGDLERLWGKARFLTYYFVCVLAAAGVQLLTEYLSHVNEPTVGASGGVFGVLLAFAMYFPTRRLIVIPIPVPLPAWLVVAFYGLLELFLGVTGREASVAHFAHLGGMLGGALMILLWQARDRPRTPY